MHAVELAMPQGTGSWCSDLKTRWPRLVAHVDSFVVLPSGNAVETVTLEGPAAQEAVDDIRRHVTAARLTVLEEAPEWVRIRVEITGCPLAGLMSQTGLVPQLPFKIESGWDRWVVVDQKKALQDALALLLAEGVEPNVIASGPVRPTKPLLTPHQQRVLKTAIDSGYYEQPRRTTLRRLAAEMGIGKSTVSETLMTIERKVMTRRPPQAHRG